MAGSHQAWSNRYGMYSRDRSFKLDLKPSLRFMNVNYHWIWIHMFFPVFNCLKWNQFKWINGTSSDFVRSPRPAQPAGHTQQHFPWLRSDGAARGKLSNFAEPCHLDLLWWAVIVLGIWGGSCWCFWWVQLIIGKMTIAIAMITTIQELSSGIFANNVVCLLMIVKLISVQYSFQTWLRNR